MAGKKILTHDITDEVLVTVNEDIVFEEFDGDLVVLNLVTGRYFGLNEPARIIWSAISSGYGTAAIAQASGSNGVVVGEFLRRLRDLELLTADASLVPRPSDDILVGMLVNVKAAPTVDAYDDLADLIAADPIHDTEEEAGWPHIKPAARD